MSDDCQSIDYQIKLIGILRLDQHILRLREKGQEHDVLNNGQYHSNRQKDQSGNRDRGVGQHERRNDAEDQRKTGDDDDDLQDVGTLGADVAPVELISQLDDTADDEDGHKQSHQITNGSAQAGNNGSGSYKEAADDRNDDADDQANQSGLEAVLIILCVDDTDQLHNESDQRQNTITNKENQSNAHLTESRCRAGITALCQKSGRAAGNKDQTTDDRANSADQL